MSEREAFSSSDASSDYVIRQSNLPEPLFTKEGIEVYPLRSMANYFNISRERLQQLQSQGRIQSIKPGQEIFLSIDSVRSYAESPDPLGRPKKNPDA